MEESRGPAERRHHQRDQQQRGVLLRRQTGPTAGQSAEGIGKAKKVLLEAVEKDEVQLSLSEH